PLSLGAFEHDFVDSLVAGREGTTREDDLPAVVSDPIELAQELFVVDGLDAVLERWRRLVRRDERRGFENRKRAEQHADGCKLSLAHRFSFRCNSCCLPHFVADRRIWRRYPRLVPAAAGGGG